MRAKRVWHTIVHAEGLTKVYNERVHALDAVDLSVARGEWLAVMGPSGSGKTTLLNPIACLDRPTAGRLAVAGTDVTVLDQTGATHFRRDHIGLIFQQFHLVPYLTAVENVMLAQYFHSLADEPTGNLDRANEETVMDLLRELHAAGHTLIVVTHDPLIGGLAERTIYLDHGRVVRAQRNGSRAGDGQLPLAEPSVALG